MRSGHRSAKLSSIFLETTQAPKNAAIEPLLTPANKRPFCQANRRRRLHRLLRLHPPRHERRQALPPRSTAPAQLQMDPHRLSRPRLIAGDKRNRHPPPKRTNQTTRSQRTHLRAQHHSSTTNSKSPPTSAQAIARRTHPHRIRRPTHLRPLAPQRLVRPRYPVMGIPTPRPIPRQELRHQHLSVCRADGSPASLPSRTRTPRTQRPRTTPLPRKQCPRRYRPHRRSLPHHSPHARSLPASAPPKHRQSPRPLLDIPPDDRPPHQQRLQSDRWRPPRQRNHLRPKPGLARLPPRNHPARSQPNPSPQRRTTHLSWTATKSSSADSAKNPATPASASASAAAVVAQPGARNHF